MTQVVMINQPSRIEIEVIDQLNPECQFSYDGFIRVDASGGTPFYVYTWGDLGVEGESNDELATYLGPGAFFITVRDDNNCIVEEVFTLETISRSCLDIPLAFSPNGDDKNPRWIILNLSDENREVKVSEIYPELIIEIFDRSGQRRWVSERGYDVTEEGWDGRDNFGKLLPMGSYYYFIHLSPDSDYVKQGVVTIIY